jgi:AcrR family transcriptional regulator
MKDNPHNVLPGTPAAAILAAAHSLFAAQGYAGTSIRSIAEAASVNLAMIHYYFGNKQRLYRHLIEKELGELVQIMGESLQDDASPCEILSTLPSIILEMHRQRPGLIQLLLREMNDGAPTLQEVIADLGAHGPLGLRKRLYNLIDAVQEKGLAADLPPAHLLAFLLALSHGMVAFSPLIALLTDLDLQDPETTSALGSSAETFVQRALAPNKEIC